MIVCLDKCSNIQYLIYLHSPSQNYLFLALGLLLTYWIVIYCPELRKRQKPHNSLDKDQKNDVQGDKNAARKPNMSVGGLG